MKNERGFSVLAAIGEVEDFVRHCMKDPEFAGFNVLVVKVGSAIVGKNNTSLKPKYVFHTPLDYVNPVERTLIENAIHKGMHGKDAAPEQLEKTMIDTAEDY